MSTKLLKVRKLLSIEECDSIPVKLANVDSAHKVSTLLEIMYTPPETTDIPWQDVSVHLRDKFEPFIELIKEFSFILNSFEKV